jgi:polyisoprenoid-binding protein YceI
MARLERSIRQAGGWAALAIIALAAPKGALAEPGRYTAGPPTSRLTVQVRKKGLLSGMAHDHDFLATAWRAGATLDPAEGGRVLVEVVVQVASLEDQQPALSTDDRGKVNKQAAQTLDAARFPELRFTADQAVHLPPEGAVDLAGTLTLHGKTRPSPSTSR